MALPCSLPAIARASAAVVLAKLFPRLMAQCDPCVAAALVGQEPQHWDVCLSRQKAALCAWQDVGNVRATACKAPLSADRALVAAGVR